MTSSQAIIDRWNDIIWACPEMREFTTNFHAGDVIGSLDTTHSLKDTLSVGRINLVQFYVRRYRADVEVGCCGRYIYSLQIEYYLEDTECEGVENQNKIQAFFEKLDDVVCLKLGEHWDGLVTSYDREDRPPDIRRAGLIDNRPVFVGSYSYSAEQQIIGCAC